jgi:hypothetical protein
MTPKLPNRSGQNTTVVAHDLAPDANADHQTFRAAPCDSKPSRYHMVKWVAAGVVLLAIAVGLPA